MPPRAPASRIPNSRRSWPMPLLTETIAAPACDTAPTDLISLLGAKEQEVARVMQICNACRYCEGFCAVFPAMTRRLEFNAADTHYLAYLCHKTYQDYAWPRALGELYRHQGVTVALALAGGLALFLVLAVAMSGHLVH